MSLQYSGSYNTDACTSSACGPVMSAGSSLPQGETFAKMTSAFHGGRRSSRRSRRASRKSRRASRRSRMQRGGSAPFPSAFADLLPTDMHKAADITSIDKAYAQLPEFAGKYGMSGGSRRSRKMRGGSFLTPAPISQPSMILTPQEEPAAFLNPQWYTENQVVPSFKGPENAYATQQAANQFNYAQKAGSRKRKASKKSRKASKKSRKASKKSRKASRKSRRSSRK